MLEDKDERNRDGRDDRGEQPMTYANHSRIPLRPRPLALKPK